MEQIEAMKIFMRVAELRSFTQAAESLSLPKANASVAVAQLESKLGTRLLNRTTRRVSVTPDGQMFYERCRVLVADMDDLENMFAEVGELRGRLRVDMPLKLSRKVIARLGEFLERHPQLELELSTTDRMVDVVAEGFDCVLRVGGWRPGSDLNYKELGTFAMVNCASPAYLERYGIPKNLDELKDHHLIHYLTSMGERTSGFEYWDGKRNREVPMKGNIAVNNSDAYQTACLAGLGFIQVPWTGVDELVNEGQLKTVLPEYTAKPMPVRLVYLGGRRLTRRARVFRDWLVKTLGLTD